MVGTRALLGLVVGLSLAAPTAGAAAVDGLDLVLRSGCGYSAFCPLFDLAFDVIEWLMGHVDSPQAVERPSAGPDGGNLA